MPESRGEAQTAYIRMEGMPGLWFAPELRTPHNAATSLERLVRPALIVALGVIMLLCLLRGLTERGEWRVWTSAYTGAALFNVVWGIPATAQGHVDMGSVAAILAPGVALMLLPHVGRHLMRTRKLSRAIDIQYFLLSLPGAALALIPLLPGFSWTLRFLDLWPLGTLILLPTTLGAWLTGLPGARRFLLGCLLPPAGVAVGLLGMGSGIPAPLLGTAPMWGLALGALIIAGTAAARDHAEAPVLETPPPTLLDDPALRIISQEELARENALLSIPDPAVGYADDRTLALEEQLRTPLDSLLRDGVALEQCSLPPAARQLCESMLRTVRSIPGIMTSPGMPSAVKSTSPAMTGIFDLQEVLRQAHDAVSPVADHKNIALSWFMPPHLAQCYRGDAAHIGQVLRMLLESSVRATSRGAVQLAVRRVPESVDPGHLLFSVTDTGAGTPPTDRSSLALVRAWELAGAHRGFLSLESSPLGASISFTLRLDVAAAETTAPTPVGAMAATPGVIVVDDSPSSRQLLSFFLEGLPFTVAEARSAEEALELHAQNPARLFIFDADMPLDLPGTVERIRESERAKGFPPAMLMALSSDDNQWGALSDAGFTHALPKPVTRAGLRNTVCELLPQDEIMESAAPMREVSEPLRFDHAAADEDDDIIDTGMPLPDAAPDVASADAPDAGFEAPLSMTPDTPPPSAPQRDDLLDMAEGLPQWETPAATPLREEQGMPDIASTPSASPDVAPFGAPDVVSASTTAASARDQKAAGGEEPVFSPLSMEPEAAAPVVSPPPASSPPSSAMPDVVLNSAPDVAPEIVPDVAPAAVGKDADGVSTNAASCSVPAVDASDLPPQEISPAATPPVAPFPFSSPLSLQTPSSVPETAAMPEPPAPTTAAASAEAPVEAGPTSAVLVDAVPVDAVSAAVAPVEKTPGLLGAPITPAAAVAPSGATAPPSRESATPGAGAALPHDNSHAAYLTSLLLDAPQAPSQSPSPVAAPAPAPVNARPNMLNALARASENHTDWVGEPTPIVKTPSAAASPSAATAEPVVTPRSAAPQASATPAPVATSRTADAPLSFAGGPASMPTESGQPFFGGFIAQPSMEWVGEPTPIIKTPPASPPQSAAPAEPRLAAPRPAMPGLATPSATPAPSRTAVTPPPASAGSPAFTPLSMEPDANASQGARPSLMPQSVPLMEYIIADSPAAAPSSTAPSSTAPASTVPASPSRSAPAPGPQPKTAQPTPPARPAAVTPAATAQARYANVGEPVPMRAPSRSGTSNLPLDNLLEDFDRASHDARQAYQKDDADGVRLAARYIAGQADNFGLRALARMARCVEDAAKAKDRDALGNLLPELELFVERNRIAMRGR